jgi:hypothetical protein
MFLGFLAYFQRMSDKVMRQGIKTALSSERHISGLSTRHLKSDWL